MPPKRGGRGGQGANADLMKKIVEENIKQTAPKEFINPIPQKEIVLQGLVTHGEELTLEDAYRRKKWVIFCFCLMSNIIGIIISLYSMHQTVLFQELPTSWTYFGVSCIFYIPCWVWFFWTICPRYTHCHFCPNHLFIKEHHHRKFLRDKRNELKTMRKMQALYLEGDLELPEEAKEIPDAPYEYDPAQPWAYIRWKPKPPTKVRYDEEGIAWIVTPEDEIEQARLRSLALAAVNDDTSDSSSVTTIINVGRKSSVALQPGKTSLRA